MRNSVIAIVALLLLTAAGAPAAEAKTCRHGLYLKSGISEATVKHVTCRRAVRSLRRWVRHEMPVSGPPGWRCARRHHGGIAPYDRYRCARGRARMRFTVGG
jgi:hypothetical protein